MLLFMNISCTTYESQSVFGYFDQIKENIIQMFFPWKLQLKFCVYACLLPCICAHHSYQGIYVQLWTCQLALTLIKGLVLGTLFKKAEGELMFYVYKGIFI